MERLSERINSSPDQISSVLKAFFLPKEFGHGFRLASEGAAMKSAAANMSLSYDAGDWDQAITDAILPASEMIACLFGNPLRAYIQYEHNAGAEQYVYTVQNIDGTGNSWPITFSGNILGAIQTIELMPRWATATSSYQPHGPTLFPGYDHAGHYYLWVNQGAAVPPGLPATARGLVVTLSVPPVAAAAGSVNYYVWNGKSSYLYATVVITTGVTTYSVAAPPGGGYMYVTVTMLEDLLPAVQTVSLSLIGDADVWGHHCVSDINSLLSSAYGIRVNSASVRLQNDSSALYRNGKIVSVTVPANSAWQSIAPQGCAFLTNLQMYRERTADKGYYGVILPDSDADVSEFYDDIAASAFSTETQLYQAAYPLVERRPFKIIGLTVPVAQGRAVTFDVTHTIEYLTNNKLVGQTVSTFSERDLIAALVIASTMETDYDNPVHWRHILNTIATYLPLGTKTLMSALQLFGYSDIANQIDQRQPFVEKFADNVREISVASSKNKRGSER